MNKIKAVPVFTESPFQNMSEALSLLELSFRLQKAFEDGLINKKAFTRSVEIDTGTGTKLKERTFDEQILAQQFHNLVLATLASLFIAVDKGLDDSFGAKAFDKNDNINSLRNVFYMLRCAVGHDIGHPKWKVKDKYKTLTYRICVPKEIMGMSGMNLGLTDAIFEFNFDVHNDKTVTIGSFYGIDGLIPLVRFALSICKRN